MIFTIDDIAKRLKNPLPGELAHLPLSPVSRPQASEELRKSNKFKESAVALILFENNDALNVVLTQRQSYQGIHSKQVSFPGGKMENFDSDLIHTAIRETCEEVGLERTKMEMLGELTPVYIPASGFKVQPYVFHYQDRPLFERQEREVAEIFTFPLPLLFEPKIIKTTDITVMGNVTLKNVPYFDIHEKIVWGATALILNEFKEVLKGGNI